MDGGSSLQSSSKELHEAIKQSLNSLAYTNTQGLNMNGTTGGNYPTAGLFRDEDLERALKLSLNPDEQASKEQQEYVLACKESIVEAKSNFTDDMEVTHSPMSLSDSPVENNRFIFNPNMNARSSQEIKGPKYNMSPTYKNSSGISSICKVKDKDNDIDKNCANINNSVTIAQKNIHSEESLSDIICVNSIDSNKSTKDLSVVKPTDQNSKNVKNIDLENNAVKAHNSSFIIEPSPIKDSNKKKRKAARAEANVKQGSSNKPTPLMQVAAAVKEAPVLSIQEIQEEERQLQEAIQKSKEEILQLEINEPGGDRYSERVIGRKSPTAMNANKEQSLVNDMAKEREIVLSESKTSASNGSIAGRVSAGAAGGYLEDEEKQLREAIERSKQELSIPDNAIEKLKGTIAIKEDSTHVNKLPVECIGTAKTDTILNHTLVQKMSEEEQLRYALQMSSKEMNILPEKLITPTPPVAVSKVNIPVLPPLFGNSNPYSKVLQTSGHSSGISNKKNINKKELSNKGQRRPIVIDGCNVAYHHGRHDMFSAQGLKVVYDEFITKGWQSSEIHIFVKPSRMTEADRELCDSLEKIGVLHWTPKRRVGHQQFTSDDDDMILEYARKKGGVIVTRDQYRDSYDRCPEFKEVIEKRLLQFNFINDDVIFPRDPLGKSGPSLEQFLRF